ncbi:MAG: hypothetical protein M3461_02635 [Pseudomonadota bacterium]|nr:hypothetical protein [Pseudomonadota bacterium]
MSGPRVWFVNNGGAAGDGRLSSPFNTLAAADTAAIANGDRTFVFTSASTYTGGFGLLINQRLIGQGVVDTNFDTALGITPPATSVARPGINGTRPTINGTITLATGGTARGFNVNNTSAAGVSGSGATGLTVNQVSVTTTTGTAVNLLNSGRHGQFHLGLGQRRGQRHRAEHHHRQLHRHRHGHRRLGRDDSKFDGQRHHAQ